MLHIEQSPKFPERAVYAAVADLFQEWKLVGAEIQALRARLRRGLADTGVALQ